MKILAIDTSSNFLSLAVFKNADMVKETNINAYRKLSSLLIPGIKSILKKSGINLDELDGFAVGVGPGSFTGLRIGISTIKAFGLALDKPIVSISSLDVIAANARPSDLQICPIIDARRDNAYSSLYKFQNSNIERISDYLLININDLIKKIHKKTIFLGDGLALFKLIIQKRLNKKALFCDERLWYPKAVLLGELSLEKFRNKDFVNSDKLVPLYLYPKECQVRLMKDED